MQHWSRLATRNWRVKQVRTAGAVLAIALGVGAVVWVSCCYESVRRTVMEWAGMYVGRSHINIESYLGKYTQFSLRHLHEIDGLPEVRCAVPLLVQRLRGLAVPRQEYVADREYDPWSSPEVDYHGIDLAREFEVRDHPLVAGRMLTPQDEYACVLEAAFAEEVGVGVGDYLVMWNESGQQAYRLDIVGLTRRRRIARLQPPAALLRLPVLQLINDKYGAGGGFVTAVDVVLRDPTQERIELATARIRAIVRKNNVQANVRDALSRMRQVNFAQQQQDVVLALLSCVAMLTSLFIILSTLSMGMLERVSQLGLLRCVGTTGRQLAALVLVEVLPLGVAGIVLGIPLGLALTALTVALVPEYVGEFVVNQRGVLLAVIGGLATTVVAASLPALGAWGVSPLEASRPRARPARRVLVLLALLLALALLAAQVLILAFKVRRDFDFVRWSSSAVVLLYLVYALAAPLMVWGLGWPAVQAVARLVGLRTRLLQDQVGHAVWRSAGICCGLMVGLSLIVALIVLNRSFKAGWEFPRQFPAAFVWSYDQFGIGTAEAERRLSAMPPVRDFTLANALNVVVEERTAGPLARRFISQTWFVGTDERFFDLVKLEFVEGDEATARQKLAQGGHVLVTVDFARTRRKSVRADPEKGVSDMVDLYFADRGMRQFRVAGVVDSPALEIAASFFQVESEARVAAVGSVLGTNADLKRLFGVDSVRLALLNFDLPPQPPPPDWPPPEARPEHRDRRVPLASRWLSFREEALLREIAQRLAVPGAMVGSARSLKERIDSELTRVTYLLSAVPAVALLVAAIGVANLMTANVASRRKQLAILRAVGATRGQVLRLVVGEALVLGLVGSSLGLALGVHLSWNVRDMTLTFWGYQLPLQVPWGFVSAAIAMTVGLCVLAGMLPARHAARANVIDALHVA